MARIEQSSRKISDIISVIDEIARQTNLLALNAAVEAARAGEAGRGFAVVASEVRSLAQRSSQAAKDIKDLIVNSSVRSEEGVQLVNRAGESLKEIVDSINEVADIVADIANASARTGHRHRADQQGADPDGRGHPAELGAGRGECRDRENPGKPVDGARWPGRSVPACSRTETWSAAVGPPAPTLRRPRRGPVRGTARQMQAALAYRGCRRTSGRSSSLPASKPPGRKLFGRAVEAGSLFRIACALVSRKSRVAAHRPRRDRCEGRLRHPARIWTQHIGRFVLQHPSVERGAAGRHRAATARHSRLVPGAGVVCAGRSRRSAQNDRLRFGPSSRRRFCSIRRLHLRSGRDRPCSLSGSTCRHGAGRPKDQDWSESISAEILQHLILVVPQA